MSARFVRVVNPNGQIGVVPEGSDADLAYPRAPSTENVVYDEYGVPIPDVPQDTYDQSGAREGEDDVAVPTKSSSKPDWVAFAVSKGETQEAAEAMTIAQIADKYPTES